MLGIPAARTRNSKQANNLHSANIRVCISVLLFACSCNPVYATRYNYSPPSSIGGRNCLSQCDRDRTTCEVAQAQAYQSCRRASSAEFQACSSRASAEHQRCVSGADRQHSECVASGRTSCRRRLCIRNICIPRRCSSNAALCLGQYNRCYSNCGGQVQATQVCVQHCPEEPQRGTQPAPAVQREERTDIVTIGAGLE